MKTSYSVLLILCALLLSAVLVATQSLAVLQRTVLDSSFLKPTVDDTFASISNPVVHEEIITFFVHNLLKTYRVSIPVQMHDNLFSAAAIAITPQWIQSEALKITKKTLAVLNGREKNLTHTTDFRRIIDRIINELAKELQSGDLQLMKQYRSQVPTSIDVTSLIDERIMAGISFWGNRYILLCLFFIYIIPAILAIICLLTGKLKWGMIAVGVAACVSGITVLIFSFRSYSIINTRYLHTFIAQIPHDFAWLGTALNDILYRTMNTTRTVSVITSAVGIIIAVFGIAVGKIQSRV